MRIKVSALPILMLSILTIMLVGCTSAPKPKLSAFESMNKANAIYSDKIKTFARDENFVVLITQEGDTLESLATKYLGDANKSWIIADFNDVDHIVAKREIVIPLKPHNPTGIYPNGYQTIPILCYHRFGPGHEKMSVSEENFRAQMQYLKDNNFHVIAMKDIYDFVKGMGALPKKSVIITIDDGYRSNYDIAFPILKEFGFHATIFLYTDFMGARAAMSWKQIKEMAESGYVDFQPHSKTHPNMTLPKIDESNQDYVQRIKEEVDSPTYKISKFVNNPLHTFAYPYGDTNDMIIEYLEDKDYSLGVTVQAGSNPTFSHPYMLHRTMIYGDHDIKDFANALTVFKQVKLK